MRRHRSLRASQLVRRTGATLARLSQPRKPDMSSVEILAFFVMPFVAIAFGWLITKLPE
jgi:hypothetical protein